MLKKDKLVEEFWKWYKTVRTVNWKELGEDYLFGPKDFLTVLIERFKMLLSEIITSYYNCLCFQAEKELNPAGYFLRRVSMIY